MARIICVSNRVSLPDPATGTIKAGGLAVGVRAALEGRGGGIWFGWSGEIVADEAARGPFPVHRQETKDITFLTLALTEREYTAYYRRMANEALWPFMHELADHIDEDGAAFAGYCEVNGLFARLLQPFLEPDDVIWVHDYHLIPMGEALRNLGVCNRVLYFHHIPVPSPDFVRGSKASPRLRAAYDLLIDSLFAYDQVGFQSHRDLRNFMRTVGTPEIALPPRYTTIALSHREKTTQFGAFPISIETAQLEKTAREAPPVSAENALVNVVLGAERLDYTKGLVNRIKAIGHLLRGHPEYIGGIKYVQITPLTRDDITRYKSAIDETRAAAAELRSEFGREGWSPIDYTEEMVSRDVLMGHFREARIGLVTPFMDGQNLVAKEFVASQRPDNPGMLVLSRRAGCAEELATLGALTVNPFDPQDIADKIDLALKMPLEERIRINHAMLDHLRFFDINHWAESFLEVASGDAPVSFMPAQDTTGDEARF